MLRRICLCCACLLVSILMTPTVQAAQKPDLVVRVVDVQEVLKKSTAMIAIRKELSAYRTQFDKEFAKKEKALRQEERDLVKQRGLVDADVYRQNTKALQVKFAKFQTELNNRQQQLQSAFAFATNDVRRKMRKIWVEVANDEGATLVLPRLQVLLFSPQYDVTDKVIKRLNQSIPSVKFPDPLTFGQVPEGKSAKTSK